MQDFAALVLEARTRKGLTQAEAATAAGLTPSYLSVLENRKKRPPSDEVCRRLARALDIPEERILEVAHLERAPAPLRNRLRSLATTLRRERRSMTSMLGSLLAPFLAAGPPGLLDGALETTGLTARRRRRLRDVLGAIGTGATSAQELERLLEELPERERSQLLDGLTRELSRRTLGGPASQPSSTAGSPATPTAPPHAPAHAPPLLFSAPRRAHAPSTPYLLELASESCAGVPELQPGDLVLVDPRTRPREGDLLLFVGEGEPSVRRWWPRARPPGGVDPRPSPQPHLDGMDAASFAALWDRAGAGVVIEIRRRARREPPGEEE